MNEEKLQESIRVHEGLNLKPYKCSEGKLTIGFGRSLEEGITIQEAYYLLQGSIETAKKELDRYYPDWTSHDDARQNVMIELVYNLGMPKLSGFNKFWKSVLERDYKAAAAHLLDSLWAKQVKGRADTLAKIMETGQWPKVD